MADGLEVWLPDVVADWARTRVEARHRTVDGTLVFTDLSGFTALSERLATLGRVGAEELTVQLDVVFQALLDVAAELGGDLLKFGGDALLLLFQGPGHSVRGATAAAAMQRRLGEVGRIVTDAGAVRLTMTAGVHSGEVDLFLVGGSFRELLVTGPAANRVVALESSASSSETVVSAHVARAVEEVDASAIQRRGDAGFVLTGHPPRHRDGSGDGVTSPGDGSEPGNGFEARRFLAPMLADEVSAGPVVPEHRQMAVGFAHLCDLDAVLAEHGGDETARRLDTWIAGAQEALALHGVSFISTDVAEGGPKLIAAAGAVRSWENDEERMLRAAVDVASIDAGLRVRVGVHRGTGFRGAIGPPRRRTFAVMGDVVNTAARVMGRAGPGQVLATPETVDRSDTVFELGARSSFAAKGKSEPVEVVEVGRPIGLRERLAGRRAPLVGRDRELSTLRGWVDRAVAGRGALVTVTGEAGLGKSRLLDEALATVGPGVVVHRSQSGRYGSSTAYLPVRSLVGALCGGSDPASLQAAASRAGVGEWAPLLGRVAAIEVPTTPEVEALDPQFARARLERAVTELVRHSVAAPTIWVMEDVHWADEPTRSLLAALAPHLDDLPLLVIVSERPGEASALPATAEVTLGPLPPDAAAELARAACGRPLLPEQVDALTVRAAGHPLFLEELAADVDGATDELPESVEALLAARIDGLGPRQRRAIRHLAVLGLTTDIPTARAVVDDLADPTDDRAWRGLERFVERAGDTLRFRHALTRDVAYAGLSFRRRRALHQAAGRYLEAIPDPPVELLAVHFSEGGDRERARRYGRRAAEAAEARFAFAEAAAFWQRAGDATSRTDDAAGWLDLAVRRGESLRKASRLAEAEQAFRSARRIRSVSQATRADLARRIAVVVGLRGDSRAAERWYRRARAESDGASQELRVDVLVTHAAHLADQGRADPALDMVGRALADGIESPEVKGRALLLRFMLEGDLAAHDRVTAELRALGAGRQLSAHLANVGQMLKEHGDWDGAAGAYADAARQCAEVGNDVHAAVIDNNVGELRASCGRFEEARAAFERARETFAAGGLWAEHVAGLGLGHLSIQEGDLGEGLGLLDRSVEGLAAAGIPVYDDLARLYRAEAALRAGDRVEATRHLDHLCSLDDPEVVVPGRRLRAAVDGAAVELRTLAAETTDAYQRGLTLDALATLADDDSARAEARALFDRLGVVANPEAPIWASLGSAT